MATKGRGGSHHFGPPWCQVRVKENQQGHHSITAATKVRHRPCNLWSHLILQTTQEHRCHNPRLPDKEADAQQGLGTAPKGLSFKLRSVCLQRAYMLWTPTMCPIPWQVLGCNTSSRTAAGGDTYWVLIRHQGLCEMFPSHYLSQSWYTYCFPFLLFSTVVQSLRLTDSK